MLATGIAVAALIGTELTGYAYHVRARSFAQEKRYFESPIDNEWIENFILEEMQVDELKTWISNSISYSNSTDNKYYSEVPLEKVPRNKMIKWTCYYLFYKSMWQLTTEEINHGEEVLKKIEKKIEITFEDFDDPDIYFLKFGNNKFECKYRPMVAYAGLSILKHIAYAKMRWNGFQMFTMEKSGMTYFYYKNPTVDKNIMFIHGLGIGITPYMTYLTELKKLGSVIVPILPNISNMEHNSLFSSITEETFFPSYDTLRYDFNKMLDVNEIDSIDVIGHSFGTIIMGILIKSAEFSQKMDKKVFVDPVCFIDRSFKIFRYINEPGNSQDGIVNSVFNLLVYNDLYVRYVSQRFLYGPEFWIMDYTKLNSHDSLLVLSNQDSMVPSNSIYQRCKKYHVQCIRVDNAHHADVFLLEEFRGVWETIKSFLTI
jgi:hypothetical protein